MNVMAPFMVRGALLREAAAKEEFKSREVLFSHPKPNGNCSQHLAPGTAQAWGKEKAWDCSPVLGGEVLLDEGSDGLLLFLYPHSSDVPNQGQPHPGRCLPS